jgi:hypothetical protein
MACVTWCEFEGDLPVKEPPTQLAEWEIDLATFSNWLRNEILQHVFVDGYVFTPPTALYAAQCSTISSAITPGTEITTIARVQVSFARVSDIKLWNPVQHNTQLSASQLDIASMTLWDSPNSGDGNYFAFGNLNPVFTLPSGQAVVYPAQTGVIVGLGSPPT